MRAKANKVVVDNLPFPNPRTVYNARWQKVFRPTLLSWASTFTDPYATNTLLEEEIVVEMWDIIYPDVDLDMEERRAIGSKLVYLVRVILCHHHGESDTEYFQAGNILNDWRTTIGTGALNVVKNYFLLPANHFHEERIKKFVRWALNPMKFNFIYGDPNADAVCNGSTTLLLILKLTYRTKSKAFDRN